MYSYESLLAVNKPRTPCQVSYLYMEQQALGISEEFFIFFTRIFNPRFVVVDENIYVEVCFDPHRLDEDTQSGIPHDQLPVWLNLFEVTQLAEEMDWEEVCELAHVIADCWNGKLKKLHPESGFKAWVSIDNELDEVFVGLHRKKSRSFGDILRQAFGWLRSRPPVRRRP